MDKKMIFNFFSWIFQILIWFFFAGTIRNYSLDESKASKISFLVLYLISYIVYLIFEFLSKEAKLLKKKTNELGIFQKMGSYFKAYPVFELYCECFHYETATAQPGSYYRRTSYKETYHFPYYSERDVSGLFYLDSDNDSIQKKYYIQLELIEEINFADSISYMDYQEAKVNFIKKNKPKDVYFKFVESKYIPGLEKDNLLILTDKEPCYITFNFFASFTFLMLGEFYKLLFNHLCIFQTYKIRKIVSTRFDLNQPEYQHLAPKLDIIIQKYNYEAEFYNYINNDFKLNKPTVEELSRAKTLDFNAPQYKISNAGIVIDEPPPKKFENEGNKKKDDNNLTGTPPLGLEDSDIKFAHKINVEKNISNKKDVNEIINISNNRRINNLPQSKTVKIYSERILMNENEQK